MRLISKKSEAQKDIAEVFSPEAFGVEGEWKKLDNTCIEKKFGE